MKGCTSFLSGPVNYLCGSEAKNNEGLWCQCSSSNTAAVIKHIINLPPLNSFPLCRAKPWEDPLAKRDKKLIPFIQIKLCYSLIHSVQPKTMLTKQKILIWAKSEVNSKSVLNTWLGNIHNSLKGNTWSNLDCHLIFASFWFHWSFVIYKSAADHLVDPQWSQMVSCPVHGSEPPFPSQTKIRGGGMWYASNATQQLLRHRVKSYAEAVRSSKLDGLLSRSYWSCSAHEGNEKLSSVIQLVQPNSI